MIQFVQPCHEFSRQEPIPGYRTTDLLGRGGYGEVWKAAAPGGVPKAIKLVFGDDSSTRAASELRSLNRIKDVRHPLILSIDRIETLNSVLVIVMELADRNLKEQFEACRNKQLPGIPQKDLLVFLRDAADALDFIYEEYALQHLDIKPENLLVFGKRVKIGDFGLVKNIYERSASLVQGMTPLYAAPESFEGKPNRHSDQYSLALVYQEMLTGELPFKGMTAAQVAHQHMHELPDLRQLPAGQQPIIARALSKDPAQRFPSCGAMIEELAAAVSRNASAAPREQPRPASTQAEGRTFPGNRAHSPAPAPQSAGCQATIAPAAEIRTDPRPSRPADAPAGAASQNTDRTGHAPLIVIGIGGTAAHVLQQLRQRISDRLGSLQASPSVKMLWIDTDVQFINQMNRDREACDEIETIPVPLRTSAEYGPQWSSFQGMISRRWLFHIPRSLTTEGMRPLGRLSLASHAKRVLTSIRAAIASASSAESAVRSSESLGIPFHAGAPRVLIVASISGGTGSGMVFDVAYAVRAALKSAGFDDTQVEGVLLHSTPPNNGRDKAIANAYSTLLELAHYSRRGNYYPGDPLLEAPAFHGNHKTFSTTHVVRLGENLDTHEWVAAADDVAEYLYCAATTAAGGWYGESDPSGRGRDPADAHHVRSFKVNQIGGSNAALVDEIAQQLCMAVVNGWRGSTEKLRQSAKVSFSEPTSLIDSAARGNASRNRELEQAAAEALVEFKVELTCLRSAARDMLVQEIGCDPDQYLRKVVRDLLSSEPPPSESFVARAESAVAFMDRLCGPDRGADSLDRDGDAQRNSLFDLVVSRLVSQAAHLSARVNGWIQDLVDHPESGVDGARHAAETVTALLRDLQGSLAKEIELFREAAGVAHLSLTGPDAAALHDKPGKSFWPFRRTAPETMFEIKLAEYGTCRLKELIVLAVHKQIGIVAAQSAQLIDRLNILWQDLKRLSVTLSRSSVPRPDTQQEVSSEQAAYDTLLRRMFQRDTAALAEELRCRIDADVLSGPKKLQRFLEQWTDLSAVLGLPLRRFAREVVVRFMTGMTKGVIQEYAGNSDDGAKLDIGAMLSDILSADPGIVCCTERAVLFVPEGSSLGNRSEGIRIAGRETTVIQGRTNGITLCREFDGVPLAALANDLTHGQAVYKQLADSLHTRLDVKWDAFEQAPIAPIPHGNVGDEPDLSKTIMLPQTEK